MRHLPKTETRNRTFLVIARYPVVCLALLMSVMCPINSRAAGSDLTFNPDVVNLHAVVGTQTDTQNVQIANVSGKAITISGVTQEGGAGFSEANNCVGRELAPGASCTMRVSFAPLAAGGRNHITNVIFGFYVAGSQVAFLGAHSQAI